SLSLIIRPPPRSTPFPYTTLFRSLMPLTDFFLDHVPGYNKFRAVTIILVIVELTAPVLGMLYLDRLLKEGRWDRLKDRRFLIPADRKSTRLNSSHVKISYAVFCLK